MLWIRRGGEGGWEVGEMRVARRGKKNGEKSCAVDTRYYKGKCRGNVSSEMHETGQEKTRRGEGREGRRRC